MPAIKSLPNRVAIARRRRTGLAMLQAYLADVGELRTHEDEHLIDALADLLHAIDSYSYPVHEAVRIALNHFTEERAGRES